MPDCAAPPEPAWSDLGPLIDQELNALADNYRVPVVLCDLEGKSQREAAKQLGWPEETLMTRLARARQMLAKRLSRQGVALSAGALAMLLTKNGAAASVPATLTASTTKAAALVAGGQAATALLTAKVTALTEGVLQAMFIAKIKSAALILFMALILGAGISSFLPGIPASQALAAEKQPDTPIRVVNPETERPTALVEQERGGKTAPDPNAANFQGKIVAVAKDGKSFTLESTTSPTQRGEEAVKKQVTIKIDDKTELKFFGVGPDGAKLAVGLSVQIWITADAKDVAAKIQIGSIKEDRLGLAFSGKLAAVSKDGRTLTFESGRRGDDANTTEIKLTARTMLAYADIAKNANKPTVGYDADVWLERGSKTDAAAISFRGAESPGRESGQDRAGQRVNGKVVGIGKDGKSFTIEVPPTERGQAAEKLTITISANTRVIFNNVGPSGAHLTEGHSATITLADGSKDTAFLVTFAPPQQNVRR
jgi:hypothetical protein